MNSFVDNSSMILSGIIVACVDAKFPSLLMSNEGKGCDTKSLKDGCFE